MTRKNLDRTCKTFATPADHRDSRRSERSKPRLRRRRRPPLRDPNEDAAFFAPPTAPDFAKVLYKDGKHRRRRSRVRSVEFSNYLRRSLGRARAPWEIRSGESFIGAGSGLFKSIDGGTPGARSPRASTAEDGLSRIGIAVAQSQPNRVYATVEAKRMRGVYRSDDAGESWKP